MANNVLIKPVISEKASNMVEKMNRYTFYIHPTANKIEVKKAVEKMYGVSVVSVNTSIMPRKARTRFTKAGFISGATALKKKAVVTLQDGDEIDFYGEV